MKKLLITIIALFALSVLPGTASALSYTPFTADDYAYQNVWGGSEYYPYSELAPAYNGYGYDYNYGTQYAYPYQDWQYPAQYDQYSYAYSTYPQQYYQQPQYIYPSYSGNAYTYPVYYQVPACSYDDHYHSSCTQYQFNAEMNNANNSFRCEIYGDCWSYYQQWPYDKSTNYLYYY